MSNDATMPEPPTPPLQAPPPPSAQGLVKLACDALWVYFWLTIFAFMGSSMFIVIAGAVYQVWRHFFR